MKVQRTISLQEELAKWVDKQVDGIVFRNFSHFIEILVADKKMKDEAK